MSRAYLRCQVTATCDECERDVVVSSAMVTYITWAATPQYRFVCPECRCVTTREASPGAARLLTGKEWRCWMEYHPEEQDPARASHSYLSLREAAHLIVAIRKLEEVPGPAAPGQPWKLPNDFPTPRLCDAIAEAWPGDV